MIPSNVDPRRPDKVQRYKAPQANGNAPGEDMTPDYMNILGAESNAANAEAGEKIPEPAVVKAIDVVPHEESSGGLGLIIATTNATNVIPTSPQYGVAIIANDQSVVDGVVPQSAEVVNEVKVVAEDAKDMHSTPSRNDRFKVVKIASLEPFKRGRWKCMDYVDETPPPTTQASKVPQSAGSVPIPAGMYLQTQSLPQQHIQQMLLQGGFPSAAQFFQNLSGQVMPPHTQYFYAQQPQQMAGVLPSQYINAAGAYFQPGVVPTSGNFTAVPQNVQYVPTNILGQNQNSAFVPTTQLQQNSFQQAQTYAGQPNVPLVNGHAYPPQNEHRINEQWFPADQQQQGANNIPTQPAKNLILNSVTPQSNNAQPQSQPVQQQQYNTQPPQPTVNYQPQTSAVPVQQVPPQQQQQVVQNVNNPQVVTTQTFVEANLPKNVYTNPQFVASVNSLPLLDQPGDNPTVEGGNEAAGASAENSDDPAKTNPVVNAIDNKIEQAMDLVKSHLMYTVREEVEVLKEKIAELMERIQQLETENNFLRSQIPKGVQQAAGNGQGAGTVEQQAPPSQ